MKHSMFINCVSKRQEDLLRTSIWKTVWKTFAQIPVNGEGVLIRSGRLEKFSKINQQEWTVIRHIRVSNFAAQKFINILSKNKP